mgnify:CR=1 FL=1
MTQCLLCVDAFGWVSLHHLQNQIPGFKRNMFPVFLGQVDYSSSIRIFQFFVILSEKWLVAAQTNVERHSGGEKVDLVAAAVRSIFWI